MLCNEQIENWPENAAQHLREINAAVITVEKALDALDKAVLMHMNGYGESFAFNFSALTGNGLSREKVRAICRDLVDRGLCFYAKGLSDDSGEPRGAGYGITQKGCDYVRAKIENGEWK